MSCPAPTTQTSSSCLTASSFFSLSTQSNSSTRSICLIPPPLADRLSSPPSQHTFWGSCHNHTTIVHIHAPTIQFCGIHPPIPGTDDNNVYDTNTWRNINGDWNVSLVLQHYNGGNVMITHYFLSFSTIYLCLLFVSWPVDCSSPIDYIPYSYLVLSSWSQNYPFNSRIFFPEYSIVLLIVLLPSSAFFCLVIMIGVYKFHSSPLLFPMLVYFVLLAPIHLPLDPLDLFKSSSYFWVDTSLFEPLNLWSNSIWVVTSKYLNVHLCLYSGRTFDFTKSMLIPTQAKHNSPHTTRGGLGAQCLTTYLLGHPVTVVGGHSLLI